MTLRFYDSSIFRHVLATAPQCDHETSLNFGVHHVSVQRIQGNHAAPRYIRIFNKQTEQQEEPWFYASDAAMHITPEDYLKLQKIGITQSLDDALSAKVIGAVGQYRFRVLKDHEQYGFTTTLTHHKEDICQQLFSRVQRLQAVERAYGDSGKFTGELKKYKQSLETETQTIKDKITALKKEKWSSDEKSTLTKRSQLLEIHQAGLESDLASAAFFLNVFKEGGKLTHHAMECFIRARLNGAIRSAKQGNEAITVSGNLGLFRGELAKALVDADKTVTLYLFDQEIKGFPDKANPNIKTLTRRILPLHQGILENGEDEQKRVLLASELHCTDKASMRRFLLAGAYVLEGQDVFEDIGHKKRTVLETRGKAPVRSRGWSRFFKREQSNDSGSSLLTRYYELREKTQITQPGWRTAFKLSLGNTRAVLYYIGDMFVDAAKAFRTSGYQAYRALVKDVMTPKALEAFLYETGLSKKTPKQKADAIQAHLETFNKPNFNIQEHIKTKNPKEFKDLDDQIKILVEKLQQNPDTTLKTCDLLITRGKQVFRGENPNDPLSFAFGGVEAFFNTFDTLADKSPASFFYGTVFYGLCGLAAIRPEIIMALGKRLGINLTYYASANVAIAQAMSSSEASQFVSAGFTAWQVMFASLDLMASAGDSVAAGLLKSAKEKPITLTLGLLIAYYVGFALTSGQCDIPGFSDALREDLGTQPYIEQAFAGAKTMLVAFESTSLASVVIRTIMQVLFLPIRLVLSLTVNFIYSGLLCWKWHRVYQPWTEALGLLISLVLRVVDITRRVLYLTCRWVKLMLKMTFEWFINTLAIIFKLLGLALELFMPEDSPCNLPARFSRWLISSKFELFKFIDTYITRPLTMFFNTLLRNVIAYYLRNKEHQVDTRLDAYFKGDDDYARSDELHADDAANTHGASPSEETLNGAGQQAKQQQVAA